MKKTITIILFSLFSVSTAHSWDGYNWTTGTWIDIETYDHGGNGEGEVEYYDYGSGNYKYGYLDMESGGSGTLLDYNTGEWHWVEMD